MKRSYFRNLTSIKFSKITQETRKRTTVFHRKETPPQDRSAGYNNLIISTKIETNYINHIKYINIMI